MNKVKMVTVSVLMLTLLLTGCIRENLAEKVYDHLEEAVSLEQQFTEQQQPLAEAESREYEIYEEVLRLSNMEEISPLISEVKELANTRTEMLKKEKESIDAAYNEFLAVISIIEEIEDEELKQAGELLVEAMEQRYTTYQNLYENYHVAIGLDLELYDLVLKEDLTIEQLQSQHDLVNASYENVNNYKDKFNEFTKEYNDRKRDFYLLADLNVIFE